MHAILLSFSLEELLEAQPPDPADHSGTVIKKDNDVTVA